MTNHSDNRQPKRPSKPTGGEAGDRQPSDRPSTPQTDNRNEPTETEAPARRSPGEATDADQTRPGRRPEGPAHAREGSALHTLKRTWTEFSEDNLTDSAAALTYYAILSIFPALLALVAIVGLVGDPHTVTKEMTTLVTSIGPASAAQTFKGPIEGLTKSSGTAGILLIVVSRRRCGRPRGMSGRSCAPPT